MRPQGREAGDVVGLHLTLNVGVPGSTVRDTHQEMGGSDTTWPVFPPRSIRATLTVFDVAEAGLMVDSVPGRREAMWRWAPAV